MNLKPYRDQVLEWPRSGRHILAAFDETSVTVYQAYRPAIGLHAAAHQRFGGEFSFSRMSWIKTNFLWMMHRSGWGAKEGQEVVLAVTIPRSLFDEILTAAVSSAFDPKRFTTIEEWKDALANSDVRLQWDPDHGPGGEPQQRRAVQLGLRGTMLRRYAVDEVICIEDISGMVAKERVQSRDQLMTPEEKVCRPGREDAAVAIGLDPLPAFVR